MEVSNTMNGGEGPYSYFSNSTLQRISLESSKMVIEEAISQKLDIQNLPNSNGVFKIADFGCSVGPNTFFVVQNIIEAIELKYKSQGFTSDQTPEFHVSFSDQTLNDFNTLFASLPLERRYLSAGVPGSFHTRLFPRASLHFVHTSLSIHFLSKVPKEVVDIHSSAFNKGRIYYTSASSEVVEAFSAQFAMDFEAFLKARAEEIVGGGLMAILIPASPNETPVSMTHPGILADLLGSCLMDMAKLGIVDEAKVDAFNLPIYSAKPKEVEGLVKKNGFFNIEKLETVVPPLEITTTNVKMYSDHIRAVVEGMIKSQFGSEILDELFDRYTTKLNESLSIIKSGKANLLILLLKRNK